MDWAVARSIEDGDRDGMRIGEGDRRSAPGGELPETEDMATRTHAAVVTLAATLEKLAARLDRRERRVDLNSFAAYVLFTVLLGAAFYLLYRSRVELLHAERDAALTARAEATTANEAARLALAAREEGSRRALDLWNLIQDGRRAEALERAPELDTLSLSPVERVALEQGMARARAELVDLSYASGVEAVRAQQWKRATTELGLALSLEEEGRRATQMRYYYGVALLRLGDSEEAARQLELAVTGGIDRPGGAGADARFHLARALEMQEQLDRARAEYLRFSEGNWNHSLGPTARRRAADILRRTQKGP
jgi:tetratricopeptide (TPR) repeat protein